MLNKKLCRFVLPALLFVSWTIGCAKSSNSAAVAASTPTAPATPPPVEGTLATPVNITAAFPITRANSTVSTTGTNSYYRFTTTASTAYTIMLTGLTDNVNLFVYTNAAFSTLLCSSSLTSTSNDSCSGTTGVGITTLYVRVNSSASSGATFTMGVVQGPLVSEGTLGAPVNITAAFPITRAGSTVAAGSNSYYTFSATAATAYTITLSALSADVNLFVYTDAAFTNLFCSSNNGFTTNERCSGMTGVGVTTLYVKVVSPSAAAAYIIGLVQGGASNITGNVKYKHVQMNTTTYLNLSAPTEVDRNVRQSVVQVLDPSNADSVIGEANTDNSGNYSANYAPPAGINIKIRVLARIYANAKNSNYASTDSVNNILVSIKDNTSSGAVYSMVTAPFLKTTTTQNLTATGNYNTARTSSTAGPFSVLDTALNAFNYLKAADAGITFSTLNIYWSVNNVPAGSNKAIGQIGTSHWGADTILGSGSALFILGKADNDTDEYDIPVLGHEFGHYTESTLFRSDSIGGSHSGTSYLDPRVAFGEGFGNAFGAIVSGDPVYFDSTGVNSTSGFNYSVETNESTAAAGKKGFYNESAVAAVLWDIFDGAGVASTDGDALNCGFGPIYTVMRNAQKNTSSLTTMLSFTKGLKDLAPSCGGTYSNANLTAVLGLQLISDVTDEFTPLSQPDTSTSAPANCRTAAYYNIAIPGNDNTVPVNLSFGGGGNNKYCATKFYKFTGTGVSRTFTVTPSAGCDVDIALFRNGIKDAFANAGGESAVDSFSHTLLNATTYVLETRLYSVSGSTTTGNCTYNLAIN